MTFGDEYNFVVISSAFAKVLRSAALVQSCHRDGRENVWGQRKEDELAIKRLKWFNSGGKLMLRREGVSHSVGPGGRVGHNKAARGTRGNGGRVQGDNKACVELVTSQLSSLHITRGRLALLPKVPNSIGAARQREHMLPGRPMGECDELSAAACICRTAEEKNGKLRESEDDGRKPNTFQA
ncbi:hypothetical protein VTN00DRAFT_5946 [Thermoascus crustaceus]|uniref:uncharacterized protein n=1 Tax=Thermoascus crustaceus TaxID=5088 RepID=UPI003742933B